METSALNQISNILEKGRKMPIGTISNGRKKVAEGKWVPVKQEKPKSKEDLYKETGLEPGTVEEFEDDDMRSQLTKEDIASIVEAEKNDMKKSLTPTLQVVSDILSKGKALPEGTERSWGGKTYIKVAGGWKPKEGEKKEKKEDSSKKTMKKEDLEKKKDGKKSVEEDKDPLKTKKPSKSQSAADAQEAMGSMRERLNSLDVGGRSQEKAHKISSDIQEGMKALRDKNYKKASRILTQAEKDIKLLDRNLNTEETANLANTVTRINNHLDSMSMPKKKDSKTSNPNMKIGSSFSPEKETSMTTYGGKQITVKPTDKLINTGQIKYHNDIPHLVFKGSNKKIIIPESSLEKSIETDLEKSKKTDAKVSKVMSEFKDGTLTSHGKVVTDRKQAIAIALSEAGIEKGMDDYDSMYKAYSALMTESLDGEIKEAICKACGSVRKGGDDMEKSESSNSNEGNSVATIIKNKEGEILFLKRAADDDFHPGTWCLPGGGIDGMEEPIEAAVREVEEEANIKVKKGDLWHQVDIEVEGGKIIHYFETLYDPETHGDLVALTDGEIHNYEWKNEDEWRRCDLILDLKDHLKYICYDRFKKMTNKEAPVKL